jgi:hypothetical protein
MKLELYGTAQYSGYIIESMSYIYRMAAQRFCLLLSAVQHQFNLPIL